MNIIELIAGNQRAIANEALYYCIRALKQAGLPPGSKKDPFHDTESSKPSTDAVALANSIIEKIVAVEGTPLDKMPEKTINPYISLMAKASNRLIALNAETDVEKGAELLRRMREI